MIEGLSSMYEVLGSIPSKEKIQKIILMVGSLRFQKQVKVIAKIRIMVTFKEVMTGKENKGVLGVLVIYLYISG